MPRLHLHLTAAAIVTASLTLANALDAQGQRLRVSAERRELIASELAGAPVTRVLLRDGSVVLRETRVVGDSISGRTKTAAASRAERLAPFSVHLNDIGRLERRNLRKSIGWGVTLGVLVGFTHAQSLQAKDKLRASTTRSDAYYARQNLTYSLSGAAIGTSLGALFPSWDLIHERRW